MKLQSDMEAKRERHFGTDPNVSSADARNLIDRARERTGLHDFGDPPVTPALSVLTWSLAEEARLHRLGRFLANIHLRDLLETRLCLIEAWKQWADLPATELRCPIFVTGMPRSGSTFLHELLSLDPAHRAPRVWEVMYPVRPSSGSVVPQTLRVWRAETNLWWFRRLAPKADAVYPMRARTPHECVAMHSYTFLSQEFVSAFHIPTYEAFLDTADFVPTYAWQRRFLQYLQSGGVAPRWVLKSPDHVRSLDALWQVFPDAFVIQTHRHPLETVVSSSHLTEVLRGTFSRPQDRRHIGRREAALMAENMRRIMRFRDAHPELADRFIDVRYAELVADPLAAVKRIYARLGITLSNHSAHLIQQSAASRGRYGSHRNGRPSLEDLGLDVPTENRRFEEYCSRFGIGHFQA
ncbi:MAG: sulfotransferase [Verrucomicrobia bacterium]|jgi:hypothetical protein|nr:sulfotransferase [Verrucomicrobiota bacterium]